MKETESYTPAGLEGYEDGGDGLWHLDKIFAEIGFRHFSAIGKPFGLSVNTKCDHRSSYMRWMILYSKPGCAIE